MNTSKYAVEELVVLRQYFHQHAEPSFKEFGTAKRIKEYLLSKGVPQSCFVECASPGFYVDIRGKGPKSSQTKIVAFRADMDGLLMTETNPSIPYRSITEAAHMCGHDGHMACLIGGLTKLLDNIERLPCTNTARFLFQPAEETIGGAKVMVDEGCLNGVSEVWGLHNIPWDPKGQVYVKAGPFFAGVAVYSIVVEGKGGHSSLKKILKNPIPVLCEMNVLIENMFLSEFKDTNEKLFTFCFPNMKTSLSDNVIPNTASMRGVLRILDESLEPAIIAKMQEIADGLEEKYNVKIKINREFKYPLVNNNSHLAEELKRIHPGCSEKGVPILAGEDFSEFSNKIPGCFFLYAIGSQAGSSLHTHNYNFNDDCIDDIANIWYKIIADRLDIE